ncbi:MAG: TetR/AcrR family transcriptional regulator [Clostridia bacterium]|nr:TetR/AcrR family transcriptional regulator [Clostridia bacterium]
MNKTKRKIFETSMKLFAEKGYDATSIEEITATVGVAKGTLYYHFSSKEEIFNFLVEEGMKLLKNSIEIKTSKFENSIDKLKAVILIEVKVLAKYENLITIILNQFWGTEARNLACQKYVLDYIETIENIINIGIKKGEISNVNPHVLASTIFSLTYSILVYKIQTNKPIDVQTLYNQYQNIIVNGLLNAGNK